MKKVISLSFIFSLIVYLQIFNQVILAVTSPRLLTPEEDFKTSDTSPRLSWEYNDSCSLNESCFKVEIDDSSDFSSLNKNTYTNNLYYSPQLTQGIWYWRVKGKDINNNWSEYSQVRSFEIITESSNPSSTSSPAQEPIPSSKSSDKISSTYEISNVPILIKSDESFSAKIKITALEQNSSYYLKGAFFKDGSTKYFGKTQVLGNWVKNSENFAKQFLISTSSTGDFEGDIRVLVDPEDSGYLGSGSYIFKVGRYNASGSGPTWSNQFSISITNNQPEKISTPTPAKKSPTPSPKQATPTQTPKISLLSNPQSKIKTAAKIKTATVAGIATSTARFSSPTPLPTLVQTQREEVPKFMGFKVNTLLMAGGVLFLLIGLSSFARLFK